MTCTKTRTGMTAAVLAITAAVAIQVAANAADKTFTKDNGDLASAADWGGTKPASTDRLRFAADSAITATASSDITFAGILMDKSNQTITLDMRPEVSGGSPRTITLTKHVYFASAPVHQALNIRGGRWDITGKNLFMRGSTDDYDWNNWESGDYFKVSISDGAVMTLNGLLSGYGPNSHSQIFIAGEGTVVTAAAFRVGNINACYDDAEVSGGAELVVTGSADTSFTLGRCNYDGGSHHCGLTVTGAGSKFIKPNGGEVFVSHMWSHDCFLYVLNGATVDIPKKGDTHGTIYLAGTTPESAQYGHNNMIRVAGAGSSFGFDVMYLGITSGNKHNHGNKMEALDGAAINGNLIYTSGNGNGVVVSNATVNLVGGGIKDHHDNDKVGTNFFVRLQGPAPKFITNNATGDGGRNILHKSFKFIYDLPADGYASDFKPVQFLSESATDKSLEIEVNGIEAVLESMKARNVFRQSMVLMSASGGWSANEGVTSDMVARWNSKLPEGAALAYANNVLTLKLKRKAGIVLVVR